MIDQLDLGCLSGPLRLSAWATIIMALALGAISAPGWGATVTLDPNHAGNSVVLSNGNLTASIPGTHSVRATIATAASGNTYAEFVYDSNSTSAATLMLGLARETASMENYLGWTADSYGYYAGNGKKYHAGGSVAYGATFTHGATLGVHLHGGQLEYYVNGVSQGVAYSGLTGDFYFAVASGNSYTPTVTARFDSASWQFAPVGAVGIGDAPPVAHSQSLASTVDTQVEITLTGSDLDNDPLTFAIVTPPSYGVLSGTAPLLTYTPSLGWSGQDSFQFKVEDGAGESLPATVSLQVWPPNAVFFDPAHAGSSVVLSNHDLTASIPGAHTVRATQFMPATSDTYVEFAYDGNSPAYASLMVGIVRETSNLENYLGSNSSSYGYFAYNGAKYNGTSGPYGPTFTTGSVLGVRLHQGQLEYYLNGVSKGVAFSGLTGNFYFAVASGASGWTPTVTARFDEASWEFAPTGVLSVSHNLQPAALSKSLATFEGMPVAVTLSGEDGDGDSLVASVQTQPQHGVLSGSSPNLTYTPTSGWSGVDSFTFTVHDGQAQSAAGTITVRVWASDAVSFDPAHAGSTVTLSNANMTASIASAHSVRVNQITAAAGNTYAEFAYDANSTSVPSLMLGLAREGTTMEWYLGSNSTSYSYFAANGRKYFGNGSTAYGATFTHGSVIGVHLHNGELEFYINGVSQGVAFSGLTGDFYFAAGSGDTTLTPTVTARFDASEWQFAPPGVVGIGGNSPPRATELHLFSDNGVSSVNLVGSDPEGGSVTYEVLTGPSHGALSGVAPSLTYARDAGWETVDSFTFRVYDGELFSDAATVFIYGPDDLVQAQADAYVVSKPGEFVDVSVATGLLANDVNPMSGVMTVALIDPPTKGQLVSLADDGSFTYLPSFSFVGSDTFTYKAINRVGPSATITVTLTMSADLAEGQSPIAGTSGFDWMLFQGDVGYRDRYLDERRPGRVWEVASGGSGLEMLSSQGPRFVDAAANEIVPLTVRTEVGAPATFHATTSATFQENGFSTITAHDADGDGLVTVNLVAEQGRNTVIVGSPRAIGQVRFLVVVP